MTSLDYGPLKEILIPLATFALAFIVARWNMKRDQKSESKTETVAAAAQAAAFAVLQSKVDTIQTSVERIEENIVGKVLCDRIHQQQEAAHHELVRRVGKLESKTDAIATDVGRLLGQAEMEATETRPGTLPPDPRK